MAISDNIPSASPSSSTAPTLESLMAEIEALKKRIETLENAHNFEISENGNLLKYKGKSSVVKIPDTVRVINGSAFDEVKDIITEIIIPDSVESLENYAMSHMRNLRSVNIPASVKHIGDHVLCNCTSLENLKYESEANIHEYAFYFCTSLKEVHIPDNVQKIYSGAFEQCPNLEISIPSSCKCVANLTDCISFKKRC